MPRLTEERRAANRAAIVAAARRCFARDGFDRTSMPDLVAEAGISAGGFYRYFASKEEVIRVIAREAFTGLGGLIAARLHDNPAPSLSDVVTVVVATLSAPTFPAGAGVVDTEVQFRCAIQAWGELVREPDLRSEARAGAEGFAAVVTEALTRGQAAGRVPAGLDPRDGAGLVFTLLPGLILQRTVLGVDLEVVARAAKALS